MKQKTQNHRGAGKTATRIAPIPTATSVAVFLSAMREAAEKGGFYAFRGQENASWDVAPAAKRRWMAHGSIPPTQSEFVRYHEKTLIGPAKLRGYHRQGGREWTDLELLANLQHHGAATGLIDFTRSPLVALWFACKPSRPVEADGRVFMVNLRAPQFESVNSADIGGDIGNLFHGDTGLRYWDLEEITPRIAHQAGVFIFGRPSIPDSAIAGKVRIPRRAKCRIRAELSAAHNISARRLFGDFYGFSLLNGVDSPIGED